MKMCFLIFLLLAPVAHAAKGKVKDDQLLRELHAAFWTGWNKHDAKAMAAVFADDGTLLGLTGKIINGKSEAEKYFTDEHAGASKESSARGEAVKIQFVSRNVAVVDQEVEITGMKNTAGGKAFDPFSLHVTTVATKKSGKWSIEARRPYAFLPVAIEMARQIR